ncbi:uncharacterized protein B0I36DRAFT_19008 [Microdochium trichocladiopsis]|uniref:Zn(2)-C6 fungal-type domain-containing protein n=1 Tax=Microdochium trichocladiopsis TaxID=1682393 RepID=A0A9P8YIM9_9PEZI|nr:uncharacterized protein B0I36DRAFT_19008 [Microdochium trichocladiopsis]KAH7041074.1 hypothetical protein B0I36DRAFT_19008 [Microdochium trichocladiopsis]
MSSNDTGPDGLASGDSLACVACRSRKLKCDRTKPSCTRCLKLKADCMYPESRRKPTFKRRNVKELEARLAQVEDLLREAGSGKPLGDCLGEDGTIVEQVDVDLESAQLPATEDVFLQGLDYVPSTGLGEAREDPAVSASLPQDFVSGLPSKPSFGPDPGLGQLMGLGGLSEALPPFEVMEELHRLFFTRQQHFIPILHPTRYLHAFYSAPHMKPPMCLQYAIWCLTSNGDAKYHKYHDVFYHRARQYLEADEMKGHGEHFITLAHAQAWCLVATDEAKSMLFMRAAMSCARATQLSYMMGLHRLDCGPEDTSPTLAPPKDWAELEERRRTFWGVFCIDSHSSISTGWPHLIDVAESVTTRLPASETAFQTGEKVDSPMLVEALQGASYSSFAGAVIICHLFNIVNRHVHRGKPTDNPENFEYGGFWTRHRDIDNILSSAFMFLPECFRLPENNRDPTAIHTNLNLHAAVISLHHGAIDKIERHQLSDEARKASEDRLSCAAQEIVNIAKLTSHINNKMKSPLAALSLYSAASVYIYLAKTRREPVMVGNLDFLLAAMEAISREHAITGGFLRQAVLDIQRNDVANIIRLSRVDTLSRKFGQIQPNSIPLVARSHVSRHTEGAPPLPGRLPLGNPVGRISTRNMCEDNETVPISHGFVPVVDNSSSQTSRQDRNGGPAGCSDSVSLKRRRMSPSTAPDQSDDRPKPFTSPSQSWNTNSAHNTTMNQMPIPHRVASPYGGTYVDGGNSRGNNGPSTRSASTTSSERILLGVTASPLDAQNTMRPNPFGAASRGSGSDAQQTMASGFTGNSRGWDMNSPPTSSSAHTFTIQGTNGLVMSDMNAGSTSQHNAWDMSLAMDNAELDWDVIAASLGVDNGGNSGAHSTFGAPKSNSNNDDTSTSNMSANISSSIGHEP